MLLVCSCATNEHSKIDSERLTRMQQNDARGWPLWAEETFTEIEESFYLNTYSTGVKGFYAAGCGSSETAARIDARKNLVLQCERTLSKNNVSALTKLTGSRIVDTFTSNDGIVHVLLFISLHDAQKSFLP